MKSTANTQLNNCPTSPICLEGQVNLHFYVSAQCLAYVLAIEMGPWPHI